jgi:ELWxxDGT repeat protein
MKKLLSLPVFCLLLFLAGCINFNSPVIKLADTDIDKMILFRDAVYFSSYTDLWKTDGTENGTLKISNIDSKIILKELTIADNLLYFSADDSTNGECLWVTDGTAEGTRIVRDSSGAVLPRPAQFTVLNNKLFFVCDHPVYGSELWTSGGSAETTFMLKNIRAEIENENGSNPEMLTVCGNRIYFSANDGNAQYGLNRQLWQTDGTPKGTLKTDAGNQPLKTNPYCLSCAGEQFYFFTDSYVDYSALWTVKTSNDSTLLVKKFPMSIINEFAKATTSLQGKLYMLLNAGGAGFQVASETEGVVIGMNPAELWTSDGTTAGTQLITPIDTAFGSDHIMSLNGKLYFNGGWEYGSRLLQSDGTKQGTHSLSILIPAEHQYPFGLMEHEGKVFYFINNKKSEYISLAVTDGKNNTLLYEDFYKGVMGAESCIIYNNMIIFEGSRKLYALPLSKGA